MPSLYQMTGSLQLQQHVPTTLIVPPTTLNVKPSDSATPFTEPLAPAPLPMDTPATSMATAQAQIT